MISVPPASVVLAVLALLPAVAAGQAPAAEPTTFSGSLEVREAEVEVLVTDRDGRPVSDLTPQDFRMLEDGQPVEITNLSQTSSQPLVLAVFIDESSLSAPSRNLAIAGLRRFFASGLKPGDRVLIARYGGSLEILGEPTGDVSALGAALDRIAAVAPRGMILNQERSSLQREILSALPPGDERDLELALANANNLMDN